MASPQSKVLGIQDLPPEIRNQIYECYVENLTTKRHMNGTGPHMPGFKHRTKTILHPQQHGQSVPLMRTCHALYDEFKSIYLHQPVRFDSIDIAQNFLSRLSAQERQMIPKIELGTGISALKKIGLERLHSLFDGTQLFELDIAITKYDIESYNPYAFSHFFEGDTEASVWMRQHKYTIIETDCFLASCMDLVDKATRDPEFPSTYSLLKLVDYRSY